ncbi:MAG: serine/threonine protein kinase [Cyanobacteria bacterium J055]|nr:MAG: serine/threonine protein kinase [Cyanobacteria bacterium J055]
MSYCFHPHCQSPHNDRSADRCQSCGANLLLKSRYRIVQPLSRGSQHQTFLAVDQHRPSQPYCTIQQFSAATRGEIEGAINLIEAACDLPQLPDFSAFFEDGNYGYLVADYIEGQNLAEELETEGRWSERQIRELLKEILPVLQGMHDRQLIHGDLKPENLIRREADGKLMLVDLGSVRYSYSVATSTRRTTTTQPTVGERNAMPGRISGSAEYAAPEQLKGRAVPASDLYSLGAICIRLLTDMTPFYLFDPHTNGWTWRSHLKTRVSPALGRLLDRLLETSLRNRYRSAADVLADLERKERLPQAIRKWARWDLAATVGAGVALALVTLMPRSPDPLPQPAFQPAPEPVPEPKLYHLPLRPYSPRTHTLSSGWGSVWSIAVSPDGRTLVSGGEDGTLQIRQLDSTCFHTSGCDPDRVLVGHTGAVWAVAISPDGRFIASAGKDRSVKLWNLQTGTLLEALLGHQGEVFDVAFSPDSRTLASVGEDGKVRLWATTKVSRRYATISSRQILRGHTDEVRSVVFLPQGDRLVTGSADGTIALWDLQAGRAIARISQSSPVWSVAMSPDGRTLASSTADGTISLWDVETGQSLHTLVRQQYPSQSLAFSPDGRTLASGDVHGTIERWDATTGERLGVLKQHSGWVDLAFDPKSQMLFSGSYDDSIAFWQMPR